MTYVQQNQILITVWFQSLFDVDNSWNVSLCHSQKLLRIFFHDHIIDPRPHWSEKESTIFIVISVVNITRNLLEWPNLKISSRLWSTWLLDKRSFLITVEKIENDSFLKIILNLGASGQFDLRARQAASFLMHPQK